MAKTSYTQSSNIGKTSYCDMTYGQAYVKQSGMYIKCDGNWDVRCSSGTYHEKPKLGDQFHTISEVLYS